MLVRAVVNDTARVVRGTHASSVLGDLARIPRPDVLVLDVTIGAAQQRWALLDVLSTDQCLSTIPVVVTPATSELLAGHNEALQRPVLQVWSEPFDPADLLAAIDSAQSDRERSR